MRQVMRHAAQAGVSPDRVVVILPARSSLSQARAAWYALHSVATAISLPMLHTWSTWSESLSPWCPDAEDLRFHAVHDSFAAQRWLRRCLDREITATLVPRLLDLAYELAGPAAAQRPEQRASWAQSMISSLGIRSCDGVLAMDAALQQLALTWVGSSRYDTDAVHAAEPALLLVLQDADGVSQSLFGALQQRLGTRCQALAWPALPLQQPRLHRATDADDEAHRAAACVLQHVAESRLPVGLVAQDRLLTRRVVALLRGRGLSLRDEAGWKLSTTRAAATLAGLLRLGDAVPSTDTVLDWLTQSHTLPGPSVRALHDAMRSERWRRWQDVPQRPDWSDIGELVDAVRGTLGGRVLASQWPGRVRRAMELCGLWESWYRDAAGSQIAALLQLDSDTEPDWDAGGERWTVVEWCGWLTRVLEQTNFQPSEMGDAQVLVLAPAQLRGRILGAVVWPGCDEQRMQVALPPGRWSPAQRTVLGLPSLDQLRDAMERDWTAACTHMAFDALYRCNEGDEALLPGLPLLRWLSTHPKQPPASDPRTARVVVSCPTEPHAAHGGALQQGRISASAYKDLRLCPYRYFGARLLGLRAADELDVEVQKVEFGSWVHAVLQRFHEALRAHPGADTDAVRDALMTQAETQVAQAVTWPAEAFVAWDAEWQAIRPRYLEWLRSHEALGARFARAEQTAAAEQGGWVLRGRIDRVDTCNGALLLLDYKTESASKLAQRVRDPLEDVQLAFYALLEPAATRAAYVSLQRDEVKSYALTDLPDWGQRLAEGMLRELEQVRQGAALAPLGAGDTCTHCSARGLCRRDFWNSAS